MTSKLEKLAEDCGIASTYVSEQGETRQVPPETKRHLLDILGIDPAGRAPGGLAQELRAEPDPNHKCHVPPFLRRGRCWGMTCQLYGLRSGRNWGIGDFGDLARLAEIVGAAGADFLGVNPVHALYPADPERSSPYAPSSRQFLNVLYIAPDLETEFEAARGSSSDLDGLRSTDLVEYGEVSRVKLAALEKMYRAFLDSAAGERRSRFETYREQKGESLERHCTFEALHEHFGSAVWWEWPQEYRGYGSEGVQRFRSEKAERIGFFSWLQWLADRQLARAQEHARAAGMRIGLYLDIAVGVPSDSAAVWADPGLMAQGARIGAPPDAFNAKGQDWGLVPYRPTVLLERGLEPFRADLVASMSHAGAVRLDHAMALQRLYWVPADASALEGGYVHYPFAKMLSTVAAESRRWRSLVIGEALGTVPESYTRILGEAEVQSYRLLIFEKRRSKGFRRPGSYPRRALGCITTHDLPTLVGWWQGRDIEWRGKVGFISEEDAETERRTRAQERRWLWEGLISERLLPQGPVPEQLGMDVIVAAHRFLAKSPVRLMGVQIEDALGEVEQANLPGPSEPHPNWRRKLTHSIDEFSGNELFRAVTEAMAEMRPRG